ncbi:MAG: universal stress protein [Deltaproteobacteria bacterium]|nr:universal stress protein [Deltaproteobacteria bacterium]
MFPIRCILCPTDFSKPSHEAIKAANELARQFSAELILFHVLDPIPKLPPYGGVFGVDLEAILSKADAAARNSLEKLAEKKISTAVPTRIVTATGVPADEIEKFAAAEPVDMIVIATHGHTGWRHLVFGSVAEKVVRHAGCPVVTIRDSKKNKNKSQAA